MERMKLKEVDEYKKHHDVAGIFVSAESGCPLDVYSYAEDYSTINVLGQNVASGPDTMVLVKVKS